MKKLRSILLALLSSFHGLPALAQSVAPQTNVTVYTRTAGSGSAATIGTSGAGNVNLLNDAALNGTVATTLTVIIPTARRVSKLEADIHLTTDGGLSALAVTILCSKDEGATYSYRLTESCAAGTCAVYKKVYAYSTGLTTGDILSFEYDARTCTHVKISVDDTGADAGDTIKLRAQGVVGL